MPLPRAVTLRFLPLLCLPLLLAPMPAGAQADATPAATALPAPSRFTMWVGGGYGRGAAGQYDGMEEAVTVNVSAQSGPLLLSVRAAGVSSSIFDWSSDFGLLAGVASSPARPFHVGAAIGLGAAHTTLMERRVFTVPAEVQLSWRFSRVVGLGLYGFASLNSADSFGGVVLAFQLGRLR